ncbi:MAG TPA: D-glycero-beta-D-manno-heptose 1-phosphate adenylyltransferase [Geminicoccaceae bacterium]|nr:D-glycero-beta-D-manno-heptose 1-phosphate adenylyltransferase [Geminicoccaceae bacterium]
MPHEADHGLATLIERLADARVVALGDVMLDRFVEGAVGRISPEAPIPVLRVERERAMLGGAANVLANLAALGVRTGFVAVVGDDRAGAELAELFRAVPGADATVIVEPGRTTPVKTRFVAGGQQLLRADRETTLPIASTTAARVRAAAVAALESADALVLSDYAKGTLTGPLLAELIDAAVRQGKPVLVDPKGRDVGRYRGATLVKPNRAELALATGLPVHDDAAVLAAARDFLARCGCAGLAVTLGAEGMLLLDRDGGVRRLPGRRAEVFDVAGAGDTVLATLAAATAAGGGLDEAARLATLAGSVVVGRRGVATADRADLRRALAAERRFAPEAKLFDAPGALRLVEAARHEGRRIGFTNGCFDILHTGHVSLLARARGACDLLVVGVNSDASIRRLKGPERPVNDERTRCLVLASLASVDAVVPFEEDTPLALIERLRPDLLVKGADYALEQVVGGDLVRSWGGEVMLAELVPGVSTTATITRIGATGGLR